MALFFYPGLEASLTQELLELAMNWVIHVGVNYNIMDDWSKQA